MGGARVVPGLVCAAQPRPEQPLPAGHGRRRRPTPRRSTLADAFRRGRPGVGHGATERGGVNSAQGDGEPRRRPRLQGASLQKRAGTTPPPDAQRLRRHAGAALDLGAILRRRRSCTAVQYAEVSPADITDWTRKDQGLPATDHPQSRLNDCEGSSGAARNQLLDNDIDTYWSPDNTDFCKAISCGGVDGATSDYYFVLDMGADTEVAGFGVAGYNLAGFEDRNPSTSRGGRALAPRSRRAPR